MLNCPISMPYRLRSATPGISSPPVEPPTLKISPAPSPLTTPDTTAAMNLSPMTGTGTYSKALSRTENRSTAHMVHITKRGESSLQAQIISSRLMPRMTHAGEMPNT